MDILKFENLPVNTLVGASSSALKGISAGVEIDKEYRAKFAATKCVRNILDPFFRMNEKAWKRLPDIKVEAPVFILGHWRSGTTFVHNVLSCDSQFGYCTTYQTVFPNLMLKGDKFFKTCTAFFMPSHRPTDSMELGTDLPQEEEFALVNMMPYSFYNFWIFPKKTAEYIEKYLLFNDITEQERETFKRELDKIIKISLYKQGKKTFLSKNPPHTGRISTLIEMYPDAKFVYLVRNPYSVFESTKKYFGSIIKSLQLQNISSEEMEENIIRAYKGLFEKYEAEKSLIPEGHLFEMKFEDFEAAPLEMAEKIYSCLSIEGFDKARNAMAVYLESHKGFKKNKYNYAESTVRAVEENWSGALKLWNYSL